MGTTRSDIVGVALSAGGGLLLLPVLLFWHVSWFWATAVSVTAALVLAILRHRRPGLFDGYRSEREHLIMAGAQGRAGAASVSTLGDH